MRAIGVSHTARKDELRRNLRSHSLSVFFFIVLNRDADDLHMRRNMFTVSPRRCTFHSICELLTTVRRYWGTSPGMQDEFFISMVCRLDPQAVGCIYACGAR